MAQKILICGDSFAADWTVKYKDRGLGWPNLLAKNYSVTNVAQAGCGEYKIFKQLEKEKLNKYDYVIISHTSPYRLHTCVNPAHANDRLHKDADFIYNDIKEHVKTNKKLDSVIDYYENYFDVEYACFVHSLICKQINDMTKCHSNVIHTTHINWSDFYYFDNMLSFNKYKITTKGMNHYNEQTNQEIYNKIISKIV